jgi:hypothetical protein
LIYSKRVLQILMFTLYWAVYVAGKIFHLYLLRKINCNSHMKSEIIELSEDVSASPLN